MIDGQRDWQLCRQFVDAVMHPVEPARPGEERAPSELVAMQAVKGPVSNPQLGP
jgi:hypothetical protein